MSELFVAGGKRLRPALVLLTARLGEYEGARIMPAAMAVEMVHAATLVHDDVIDRAPLRRGRPTVAASIGNESAIVVGDFYFAKAYELASRTGSAEVVAILARAVMEICAGEVRQQSRRFHYGLDEDGYMEWIHDKTATLLSACCDIGGLLGKLKTKERSALHDYGVYLGLAFQIADDVLDYMSSEDQIGKPIGHDLVEGFATLPLMLAMRDSRVAAEVRELLVDGRALTGEDAKSVVRLVRESDGPRHALERATRLASQAREKLVDAKRGPGSDALAALTTYVVSRRF
ncbi:MAG: polyprenyl synthetase family protein [Chloroflexi bacterium]|nr:MAG: polyprenyl synthetase family protein [Chloroflexota bacterium]